MGRLVGWDGRSRKLWIVGTPLVWQLGRLADFERDFERMRAAWWAQDSRV